MIPSADGENIGAWCNWPELDPAMRGVVGVENDGTGWTRCGSYDLTRSRMPSSS